MGDDSNSGSAAEPFSTIGRAVLAVRSLGRPLAQPVTVRILPGDYELNETLTLSGAEDSGSSAQATVTYMAQV